MSSAGRWICGRRAATACASASAHVARAQLRLVPHRAELAVAAVVIVLVATIDLRGAIGFSSFAVLGDYAIAIAIANTYRNQIRVCDTTGAMSPMCWRR